MKEILHDYIKNSDLTGLREYIESLQVRLLKFDDPCLLLLAIEVYLDPTALLNEEYQLDIIIFLLKCGLQLWVPNGNIVLYLFEYCYDFERHSDEEFEDKLLKLFDCLIENKQTQVVNPRLEIVYPGYYRRLTDYLRSHQAAIIIQSYWRMYFAKKCYGEMKKDILTSPDISSEDPIGIENPFT